MDASGFLKTDIGRGDVTTDLLVSDTDGVAYITCERDTVIAGLREASDVFAAVGGDTSLLVKDGDLVRAGCRVMSVSGPLRGLLSAERTALNILMRMSGIADMTAQAVKNTRGEVVIAATRKTTPGFGDFEKEAVSIGGGDPHRMGLDSMIMIKDNHIRACGGVRNAMEKASKASFAYKIEVEVDNVEDAVTAAEMGADIIMADNVGPTATGEIRDAVKAVNGRILVEASGDITLDTVAEYIGKADIVSMGCLTHSASSAKFSMDIN